MSEEKIKQMLANQLRSMLPEEMAKDGINVILPERSQDGISDDLVSLTKAIHEVGLADGSAGGLLGGEFGYGANFENKIFMLHRYCWCELDDCPWCGGDASPFAQSRDLGGDPTGRAPNFQHKKSDSRIYWYKYIGRGMEIELKAEWKMIISECMESLRDATK